MKRFLLLILLLLGPVSAPSASSQTVPVLTLREVCTVRKAQVQFSVPYEQDTRGPIMDPTNMISVPDARKEPQRRVTILSERLATVDEVVAALTSDADEDGVPGILDAAPFDSKLHERKDLKARGPKSPLEGTILRFQDANTMAEAILDENQREKLYPQERLIEAFERAGVSPTHCKRWKSKFLHTKGRN